MLYSILVININQVADHGLNVGPTNEINQ